MPTLPLFEEIELRAYFAQWTDLWLAIPAAILVTLLIIWWRQQTRYWFRIVAATLLAALLLCIASVYLFVVPVHYAGCPQGCPGWSGYPLPVARLELSGELRIGPIDFALNLLMLWLLWLGAAMIWRLLGIAIEWRSRSVRTRLIFVLLFVLLPWAMLPRILNPPQPQIEGEELRLAINARRAAEFTYRVTGVWIQSLALEDIRSTSVASGLAPADPGERVSQVCLRGYTYFFVPWRRYRISLDPSGVTALSLDELELQGSCWSE